LSLLPVFHALVEVTKRRLGEDMELEEISVCVFNQASPSFLVIEDYSR